MTVLDFFRRNKKDEDDRTDDRVALVEDSPYYVSPSFFTHGGKVASVLQLYVRVGSNRYMSFTDVIDIIPVAAMDGIDLFMSINDKLITGDEKKRLIGANATGGKAHVEDAESDSGDRDSDSASAHRVNEAQKEDFDDYDLILDSSDPVVTFRIQLLVTGRSQEAVEEQIKMLNVSLAQKHDGAVWDSLGGDQGSRLRHLVDTYIPSEHDMTSTGTNYSRLNFSVSSGLDDHNGIYMGRDAVALTSSNSSVDFDSHLHRLGIIAVPSGATMTAYRTSREETHNPPLSSQWAQAAANQLWMNRHTVHHLVFNDFDYLNDERYRAIPDRHLLFKSYDVSNVSINPLQGFGDLDDITNIFNRLMDKIVNIFDVLEGLKLTASQKAAVRDATQQFYGTQNLWTPSMAHNVMRSRLVGGNSETYPTTIGLINSFKSVQRETHNEGYYEQAQTLGNMKSSLSQAINANIKILGERTSIEPTNAKQVYYNFDNIASPMLKQVQYLNLIDYVISTAVPGDVIMIHGADHLYDRVIKFTRDSIIAAQRKGIRFVFSFDSVSATESPNATMTDLFSLKGSFYNNLDKDIDWTVLGRCNSDEVTRFSEAMDLELSGSIRANMQSSMENQVLFHRNAGRVNNFILSEAYI